MAAGNESAANDVSRVSARLCVLSVYAASSGTTRSNFRQRGWSASRRRDGSVLHELRFAGCKRELVLPELRHPARAVTRRAMPLWRDSLLRRSVPT